MCAKFGLDSFRNVNFYKAQTNKQKTNKQTNIHTYIHSCIHTYIHTYTYKGYYKEFVNFINEIPFDNLTINMYTMTKQQRKDNVNR
jgi:hypothetical protein